MRVSRELLALSTLALGFFVGIGIGYSARFYSLASIERPIASRQDDMINDNVINKEEKEDDLKSENTKSTLEREVDLSQQVRILCWVMTSPKNHQTRAKVVKETWGKRCNILYFVSTQDDAALPAMNIHRNESRNILWAKTKEGFRRAYEAHLNEADWFLKADDDTFMVMENLRNLLSFYDPKEPIFFGCKFKPYVKQGYMSGGAGYVLSKEALKRFVKVGLAAKDNKGCKVDSAGGAEDVEMGKCLEYSNVTAGDSRDNLGRARFLPFTPEQHLTPKEPDNKFWFWQYIYYPTSNGPECCSQTAISFHYVSVGAMHALEYLLYDLKVVDPKWLLMQKRIVDINDQSSLSTN